MGGLFAKAKADANVHPGAVQVDAGVARGAIQGYAGQAGQLRRPKITY